MCAFVTKTSSTLRLKCLVRYSRGSSLMFAGVSLKPAPATIAISFMGIRFDYHQLAIADVKEDLKWRSEMPPEYSRVILALSYSLRLRYGY